MKSSLAIFGALAVVLIAIIIGGALAARPTQTARIGGLPVVTNLESLSFVEGDQPTVFQNGQLGRLNLETGEVTLLDHPALDTEPNLIQWSPTGTAALVGVINDADGFASQDSVFRRDGLADGVLSWWHLGTELTPLDTRIHDPQFSPTGDRIGYIYLDGVSTDPTPRLTTATTSGTDWQTIVTLPNLPDAWAWSDDGLRFALLGYEAGSPVVDVVGISTKALVRLPVDHDTTPYFLDWTGTGDELLVLATDKSATSLTTWQAEGAKLLGTVEIPGQVTRIEPASVAGMYLAATVDFVREHVVRISLEGTSPAETLVDLPPDVMIADLVVSPAANQYFLRLDDKIVRGEL